MASRKAVLMTGGLALAGFAAAFVMAQPSDGVGLLSPDDALKWSPLVRASTWLNVLRATGRASKGNRTGGRGAKMVCYQHRRMTRPGTRGTTTMKRSSP